MLSPCSEALYPLLPHQAPYPSPPDSSRSPAAALPFPQRVILLPNSPGCPGDLVFSWLPRPRRRVACIGQQYQRVWITPRRKHARLRRDNRGGVPGERPGAALVGPASYWRRAVANGWGSRTSCHKGTPVCAAARGPVCAAADTAPRLDSPRARLGCQATFRPPVGAATRSNGRCALPSRSAPVGGTAVGTGAAALCPCCCFLSPLHPPKGDFADRLTLLEVGRLVFC